ncbi:DsbE family thiol:disulfide interchange protein [Palleronia caenipelagi]|uniref:DsbE family thiol:disulfide interchange protein n=1 Tax=Palleronia caenipelagi TaxID=2489174 RepID=A0A547Q332_9RHOB|nr:DsbE family thiol:disulfide interchange protein [Palleronia caenipelagi]TRD20785.1 DsbE family thiol:disulfide interchange protein [Palleronia caenipelagi]
MAKIPVFAVIPPLIFAGLAGLFYAGMQRENPDALPSTLVGQEAPELTVFPLGDYPVATTDAVRESGVKLVNFWASWCAPCRVEHPNLLALAEEEGIEIVGLNYKDAPDNAIAFLEELRNPFASLAADPEGRTARDWGVYGVPETFVVDADGKILARVAGPLTTRTLEKTVRPALEEALADGG